MSNATHAESFDAFYSSGANASHFMKVLHFGLAEAELVRIEAKAKPDDLDAAAFVAHARGLMSHRWGDDSDALKLYGSALGLLGGSNASISYNIAAAMSAMGQADKALGALQQAVNTASTGTQARDLLGMAAGDPDMWRLMPEPTFHTLLAPVGGAKLTRMEGVADDQGRPLHQARPWSFALSGVLVRQNFEADANRVADETGARVDLTWKDGTGTLTGERANADGSRSPVVLATLTERPPIWEVKIEAQDRLLADPVKLFAWFGALKLRDAPL